MNNSCKKIHATPIVATGSCKLRDSNLFSKFLFMWVFGCSFFETSVSGWVGGFVCKFFSCLIWLNYLPWLWVEMHTSRLQILHKVCRWWACAESCHEQAAGWAPQQTQIQPPLSPTVSTLSSVQPPCQERKKHTHTHKIKIKMKCTLTEQSLRKIAPSELWKNQTFKKKLPIDNILFMWRKKIIVDIKEERRRETKTMLWRRGIWDRWLYTYPKSLRSKD